MPGCLVRFPVLLLPHAVAMYCPLSRAVVVALVPAGTRARTGGGGLGAAPSRPAAQTKTFGGCCLQCLACLLPMASGQNCCSGCCVCLLFCLQDKHLPLEQWRLGRCSVPALWNHEMFCCMLFAVPFLLTSNGRRLKMLPRLLCVPARLPFAFFTIR